MTATMPKTVKAEAPVTTMCIAVLISQGSQSGICRSSFRIKFRTIRKRLEPQIGSLLTTAADDTLCVFLFDFYLTYMFISGFHMRPFLYHSRDTMWHQSALLYSQSTENECSRCASSIFPAFQNSKSEPLHHLIPRQHGVHRRYIPPNSYVPQIDPQLAYAPPCPVAPASYHLRRIPPVAHTGSMKRTSQAKWHPEMVARSVPLSVHPTLALCRQPMRNTPASSLIVTAGTQPNCPRISSSDSIWRRAFQIRTMPLCDPDKILSPSP